MQVPAPDPPITQTARTTTVPSQVVEVAVRSTVVMTEHRECRTRFPRHEACPACGRRLLLG